MKPFKTIMLGLSMLGALHTMPSPMAKASDHDDGEINLKGRSLNLTDLYAFREDWQDPAGSSENLILIMNTNPRSLARQQYYFSTEAQYSFHLSQILDANKKKRPTGSEDVKLTFSFGALDKNGRQPIRLSMVSGGRNLTPYGAVTAGTTTTLADMNEGKLIVNTAGVRGGEIGVFAGLREDSFYFDVERYFRVRGFLATGVNTLGTGPTQSLDNPFRSDSTAVDFASGYNVNSIVVKIPMKLLRRSSAQSVFDVWETIEIPTLTSPSTDSYVGAVINYYNYIFGLIGRGSFQQIERLARPAINEGLLISNDKLNAFNSIPPRLDLSRAASPVVAEAAQVLTKVHDFGVSKGLAAPAVGDVAAGFLPDVMRIDTAKKVEVQASAYNSDFVIVEGTTAGAMLTGGRKIEDDVMDITLSYLIAGDPSGASIKDGVSYSGGTNCALVGQETNIFNSGHKCLAGQTERKGAAKFPFLAAPN